MKRCPECRRDYYDDSLLYCLDDGTPLLEGPGSLPGVEEPRTAILHDTAPPAEAATRHLIHTTEPPTSRTRPLAVAEIVLVLAGFVLVAAAAFFGYRYFASERPQISSIAVMPFVNDSGSSDIDYLSDGMTDTLISSLSQLPKLTVKARTAVFRYKGIPADAKTVGRDLNAQAILNGRLAQRGGQLTINLELIDAQTENVIWAGQYDRKATDLVAVQTEITRDVLNKLTDKLSGTDEQKFDQTGTSNPEAYRLLLQGRYFLDRTTREDTDKALGYFQQALGLDPGCALCWADIGRAYAIEAGRAWMPEGDAFERSRDATKRALALDPDLAEGHAQLGRIQATYDLDLRAAEASYRRALELSPASASVQDGAAVLFYKLGRFDESIQMSRQALLEDPLNPAFYHNLGLTSFAAGKLPEAETAFRKALELAPKRIVSNALLSIVLLGEGRRDESLTAAQAEPDDVWRLWALAIVNSRSGNKAQSDDALHKLVTEHPEGNAFQIAQVYGARGEKDAAFQWLDTAYQKHDSGITHAKVDPQLESLRNDPRWGPYLNKIGLGS